LSLNNNKYTEYSRCVLTLFLEGTGALHLLGGGGGVIKGLGVGGCIG